MGIESVIEKFKGYSPEGDEHLIRRAYEFAERVHEGQKRLSGEPYINHPVEAAETLVKLQMDANSISAAFLHDVLEDADVNLEALEKEFGREVAELVDGVTKLHLADFELSPPGIEPEGRKKRHSEQNRSAENLRKIFLAMARDFRVMVIKLADRLHNMRTLSALPPDRQIKVATETLQIYAPLAHRLGIWQLKWQLEDLSFKYLNPREYEEMVERISKTRREREKELRQAVSMIEERLEAEKIKAEIQGRPKHLYSIYQKMLKQEVDFEQIYDLTAIRIIVDTIADCYHALGVVHDLWKPVPERFYDYIAKPKSNMYQSLHTKVIGVSSEPIEIQIRTREMHMTAEFGISAHWRYKEGGTDDEFDRKLSWLRRQLFDWQTDAKDDNEFLSSVVDDLFTDQVFVLTPRGDVIDLPAGSTPVDFAYRIHSDLGNHCAGAKVNGRIVPFNYQFKNGDIVEIISRGNITPSRDWLNIVKTSTARSRIKGYFRRLRHADSVVKGREMLEKEIERQKLDAKELLKPENLQKVAEQVNVQTEEDLLAEVGFGHVPALSVIHKLAAAQPQPEGLVVSDKKQQKGDGIGILAGGMDGMAVTRSQCCNPVPGDDVIGYVTRGRGIALHRKGCSSIAPYLEKEPDRLIAVEWRDAGDKRYQAGIKIEALDRVGLLNDISAVFSETKTNIYSANMKSFSNKTASFDLTIEVDDIDHLNDIMKRIGGLSDILAVHRMSLYSKKEKKRK